MNGRPKAYSYLRMSTKRQERGHSRERQLERSKKYAQENGLELVEDFQLEDIGISAFRGKNVAIGKLGKFLKAVEAKEVPRGSYLLVESLDRLDRREVRQSLQVFLQIINAGIKIVTLGEDETELYDEDSPR